MLNMSASREKKQRQTVTGLTEKQQKEALDQAKHKRNVILYSVLGGVAALAVIALLIWDSGVVQRNLTAYTVGSHKYTAADLDYFYYSEYNTYYNMYSSYGLIDSDTDLRDQVYSTDENGNEITWGDMFLENAVNSLTSMSILYDQAMEAGYTLSEDGAANVQSTLDSLDTACETYAVTKDYYLNYLYGPYMTESRLEKILTQYAISSEYSDLLYSQYSDAVTDEEINGYYAENANTLDTYDYYAYYVNGTAASTTDADGNTVEPTEEETAAAMEAAKALADELCDAVKADDEAAISALVDNADNRISDYGASSSVGSSISSAYSEWLMDSARTAGDVSVQESSSGYYVVRFDNRALDEYHPATYRDILISAEKDDGADAPTEEQLAAALATAETLMDQVEAGSEQTFIDLVPANSDDTATNNDGGLNTLATKTSVSDANVKGWLFDTEHTSGDLSIVEAADGSGYYLVLFVEYDEHSYWQNTAISALASTAYSDWYDGVSANVPSSTGAAYSMVG